MPNPADATNNQPGGPQPGAPAPANDFGGAPSAPAVPTTEVPNIDPAIGPTTYEPDPGLDDEQNYKAYREQQNFEGTDREFQQWFMQEKKQPITGGGVTPDNIQGTPLAPDPFVPSKPLQPTENDWSSFSTWKRAISEIPKQVVGGIDDFGRAALGFLDPLTDWLNDNVKDLRYDRIDPATTGVGDAARGISKFLTGFIPAMRGLKAIGVAKAGQVTTSMLAGAVSDFAGHAPDEQQAADLLIQLGVPEGAWSKYMASDPNDTEAEGRLKTALNGAVTGVLAEGLFLALRAVKANVFVKARSAPRTAKDKLNALEAELTDEEAKKVQTKLGQFGNPEGPNLVTEKPTIGEVVDSVPLTEATATQSHQIRMSAKTEIQKLLNEGELTPEHGVRGASVEELQEITRTKQLVVGADAEGHPGISASTLDDGNFPLVGKGVGYIIPPEALTASGRAGESLVDETIDPTRLKYFIGDKILSYDEMKTFVTKARIDPKSGKIIMGDAAPSRVAAGKKGAAAKATAKIAPDELIYNGKSLDIGDSKLYINYGKLNTSDDVKNLIKDVSNRTLKMIEGAKRGKRTDMDVAEWAAKLGMKPEDILNRPKGGVWSDAEVLAARKIWENAAANVEAAAKTAASADASKLDTFVFRRMLSSFAAINAEIRGASAESSRSLRAWGIPTGGAGEKAKAIAELLSVSGGEEASTKLANKVVQLAQQKLLNTREGVKFLTKSAGAKTADALRELYTASLLYAPSTHIVNATSSSITIMNHLIERQIASTLSGSVHPLEATVMAYSMAASVKDALRYAGKAFLYDTKGSWRGKVDVGPAPAIAAEAFNLSSKSTVGRAVDAMGYLTRTSFRALGATDEFFKTIVYRGELHALALREAAGKGLTGQALMDETTNILRNPPEALMAQAHDAAHYVTFQDEAGPLAKRLIQMRNDPTSNGIARFGMTLVLPFIKTPSRIINYAMEHSPLAVLQGKFQADWAAGGARRDLAMSKMALGSTTMLAAMDLADGGTITGYGPRDPAEREAWTRQGFQQYSVKIGDKFYSMNRMDPLGMALGLAGDISEITHRYDMGDKDMDELEEIAAAGILSLSNIMINKNYLQGLAGLMNAVTDPDRYGQKYLQNTISSMVVLAPTLNAGVARMNDPKAREINSVRDAIYNRITGLKEHLTLKKDLWGRDIDTSSGIGKGFDLLTPMRASPIKPQPIDSALMKLAESYRRGDAALPNRIRKRSSFMGVMIDFGDFPKVYAKYQELAGNEYKDPATGLGCMDMLNEMVQDKGMYGELYQMAPDKEKLTMINTVISEYRKAAQATLMEDPQYGDFAARVQLMLEQGAELSDPTNPANFTPDQPQAPQDAVPGMLQ